MGEAGAPRGTGNAREPQRHDRHGARGIALVAVADTDYATWASQVLEREGWQPTQHTLAEPALDWLRNNVLSLIVADTALRLEDGRHFLEAARVQSLPPASSNEPQPLAIIALSEQAADDADIGVTLDHADYELVKPFSLRRFRAAVRAVVNRASGVRYRGVLPDVVQVGPITLKVGTLDALVSGRTVVLSSREFSLLHALMAHPGIVLTREELGALAWGWSHAADSRAVDNTIHRLRAKIEPDPTAPRYICTERGIGYRFAVP